MRKLHLILWCAAAAAWLAIADEVSLAHGPELLRQAYRASRQACFVAEIERPGLAEFPAVTRAVFYRQMDEDGRLRLRTELYRKKALVWIFLQNETGKYAVHLPSGVTVRGGDFLRLYFLEGLFNSPYWGEMEKSAFRETPKEFHGRSARVLVVEAPGRARKSETAEDLEYFKQLTEARCVQDCAEIKESHPFIREYTLDEKTGVILALRKFNWHGRLLASRDLGKVEFNPDWSRWPDLFATPETVDYTVATTSQFVELLRKRRLETAQNAPRQSRRGNRPAERRWNLALAKHALLAAGVLLVVGAWWLRRRNRG